MSDELPVPVVNDNATEQHEAYMIRYIDDGLLNIVNSCVSLADSIVCQRNTNDANLVKTIELNIDEHKIAIGNMLAGLIYDAVDDAMDEHQRKLQKLKKKLNRKLNRITNRLKAIA